MKTPLTLTRHNARAGKKGVYSPKHNDRSFDVDHAEHIDPEKTALNVYWDCVQGTHMKDPDQTFMTFEEVESQFYRIVYHESVEAQNERNIRNRHPERNRTTEDLLKDRRTCPEETILQIGNMMNANFDQIFNLYNERVYKTADVLDTFIYRLGILDSQYDLSTAIGMVIALPLANALGSWTLSGDGPATEWVNLGGRTDGREAATERSDFLVALGQVHPAAYGNQVFRSLGESIPRGSRKPFSDCCLYTFPNSVTTDHTGNAATSASGAMTRLVVLAEVDGQDWWYPVTLFKDGMGPQRNMSYDVRLTLRATGSADPNEPVGPGSLVAGVTVKGWLTGAKYTESL